MISPNSNTLPGIDGSEPWESVVLSIRNWREEFETADSRRHKNLRWISEPVSMESSFWLDLTRDFDGYKAASLFGCWVCLCKIAARAPVRGVLEDSRGNRITPEYCSTASRLPVDLFRRLFAWAIRRGWLVVSNPAPETEPASVVPQPVEERHTVPNQTGQTPPPPDTGEGGGGGGSDWSSLEQRLRACGVDLAPETLREARRLGASADYVSAVVDHFQSTQGLGAGALRMRLTREGKLGLAPSSGWPPAKQQTRKIGNPDGSAWFGPVPR